MRPLVGLRNLKLETGNWSRRMGGSGFHFRFSDLQFPLSSIFARLGSQLAQLIIAAVTFGVARVAYAQGCAMCYTSASAAKAGAIQALRSGTLILLIPPLLMFVAIAVVVIRRRNHFNENPEWTEEQDRELKDLLAGIEPAGEQEVHRPEVESHSPVS
ncbi:MAG: hypothetical protein LAO07_08755 [Acidobacteriia bacterium]|nr:hypothetical protein [Terriglobia bacterium]